LDLGKGKMPPKKVCGNPLWLGEWFGRAYETSADVIASF
jgi:hypothetical protein